MGYNYYGYNPGRYGVGSTYGSYSSALTGAFIAFLVVLWLFAIAIAVLQIISMWKIFKKAGEEGWKAIVPVYNLITLYKIIDLSPWLLLTFFASFIPYIGWIPVLGLTIIQCNNLSKAFGKSTGFTVGLILLSPVFYMILGFGKDSYIGPGGLNTEPVEVKAEPVKEESTTEVVEEVQKGNEQ